MTDEIRELKESYPRGTRIECIDMKGEPQMSGRRGIVTDVDDAGQIHVAWEGGGSLAIIPTEDRFRVLVK